MRLVDNEHGVTREQRITHRLAKQHPVGHVPNARPRPTAVVEAHAVPHQLTDLRAHLGSHSLCHAHCRHSPRLRDADHAARTVARGVEKLWDLGRLAAPGVSCEDECRAAGHLPQELLLCRPDGKGTAQPVRDPARSRRALALHDSALRPQRGRRRSSRLRQLSAPYRSVEGEG